MGSVESTMVFRANLLVFKFSTFHVSEVSVDVVSEAFVENAVVLEAIASTGVDLSEF